MLTYYNTNTTIKKGACDIYIISHFAPSFKDIPDAAQAGPLPFVRPWFYISVDGPKTRHEQLKKMVV